ncbi:hypothetical protein [Pyrobaculum neutrophilum]|uniref:Uncharacterized protein n=1 Tax=Pyrobaculum neutrophilum (strain DSM 2338 / JCM 9278 / NBRC 100436 / V24Sta) TaxID=444157 RepID=B1YDW3_PYRNV|nr:hypothetical protein [Pyrobaculum neutrophilum]ACB39976.1 conserved hypothetical protein [Pyrobaculum neutrophilum V24Sta]
MGWWKWFGGCHSWGGGPGRGPWSHLPPHLRPGYWGMWAAGTWGPTQWSKETELRYLEELRRYITEVVLKDIDRRIEELKK